MLYLNGSSKIRSTYKYLIIATFVWFLSSNGLAQSNCAICHSQSSVQRVRFGEHRHYLCISCQKDTHRCNFCFQTGKLDLLRDGRVICERCENRLILTQEQADKIYIKVKRYLKLHPAKLLVPEPPAVKIADKDEIQTKFSQGGRAIQVSGFYQPYNPEQILILSGLSPEECAATMIHEYTHAWQSRNSPSQDRALKEGFASWVEYHYLKSIRRGALAQRLTRKSDPDYGASLVQLLEMEKKIGSKGIVNFAKTAQKLP